MSSNLELQFRLIGLLAYRWLPVSDAGLAEEEDATTNWTLVPLPPKQQDILAYMLAAGVRPGTACTREMIRRDCWMEEEYPAQESRDRQIRLLQDGLRSKFPSLDEPITDYFASPESGQYHLLQARQRTDLGYFYTAVSAAQAEFDARRYGECLHILTTWRGPNLGRLTYGHLDALLNEAYVQAICLDRVHQRWADSERMAFESACTQAKRLIAECKSHAAVRNSTSPTASPTTEMGEIVAHESRPEETLVSRSLAPTADLDNEPERLVAPVSFASVVSAPPRVRGRRQRKVIAFVCLLLLFCGSGAVVWVRRAPRADAGENIAISSVEPWQDLHALVPIPFPEGEVLDEPVNPKEVQWFESATPITAPSGKWVLNVRLKATEIQPPPIVRADVLEPVGTATANPQDLTGCTSEALCRRWAFDSREAVGTLAVSKIHILVAFHIKPATASRGFKKPLVQYWFKPLKEANE